MVKTLLDTQGKPYVIISAETFKEIISDDAVEKYEDLLDTLELLSIDREAESKGSTSWEDYKKRRRLKL